MLYYFYELNHAALAPVRAVAGMARQALENPLNPYANTLLGKGTMAGLDLFERATRRYGKPAFGLTHTMVMGKQAAITEQIVWEKPFCRLIRFARDLPDKHRVDPKLLIVAPLSGHHATLLRGTVDAMTPDHDVYVTDWIDARQVPLAGGRFDLDDYIDYLIEILQELGEDVHVIAVCQPSVPVLAAVSLMSARAQTCLPRSMTLMGGPVDTRVNPTAVNALAVERGLAWFVRNTIVKVPFPHPGMMRDVYPGFLQLTGFMNMNLDRHLDAHKDLFARLVSGDEETAAKHKAFYDEYLSVMDLTAEFFLQTVDEVFIKHALPKGAFTHRGIPVEPAAITKTWLLSVEGALDDISGIGQTKAAHDLCTGLPARYKRHHLQPDVGHYGVFNGARFKRDIAPRIRDFIRDAR